MRPVLMRFCGCDKMGEMGILSVFHLCFIRGQQLPSTQRRSPPFVPTTDLHDRRQPVPAFDEWAAKARLRQLWNPCTGEVVPDGETPRGHRLQIVPAELQQFWDGIRAAMPPRAKPALLAFPIVP